MLYIKRTLIIVLTVIMLTSVFAIPAYALDPAWNTYFYNNFPEQRVGYYHYGYTYMIQRFLYVNPNTRPDIVSSGGIDGMFGTGTSNAIVTFQKEYEEEPGTTALPDSETGKVGKNTWRAIAYMMNEAYPIGYEDWYYWNKKVVKWDYSTDQLQYYINDNTIGGTFHTIS